MLSGLIRPVRIALSAALKLFPAASDTTLYCSNLQTKQREFTVSYSVSHYLYCSNLQTKQRKSTVSCSARHYLYCSILQTKQGRFTVSYNVRHYLYCSILQTKQGNSTVSCSVSHISYSRLSPKMAFLISFSWSKTKRATMALSSAVEGSLMLDADFKRSRTLFRSESIYTVASLESRAL